MDPRMAEIFMKSTQVSTTNGTSCHMLKVGSKRRRTKAEIEADKLSETTSMREMREQLKKLQEAAAKQELESKANEKRLLKMADVIKEDDDGYGQEFEMPENIGELYGTWLYVIALYKIDFKIEYDDEEILLRPN